MEQINLLIIEDEEAQLQIYNDAIEQFNKKNDIQVKQRICKNFKEGESALNSPFFDAAIIDLKLSNSDELEGKKLVEVVYKKIRIPIFIVSGSIAQIDDIPENALLKKRLRTELMSGILKEILDIYKTGITSFLRPDGLMDQKLTEIFWHNLSKDLGIWIKHNNQITLLRYILSHFQEYLEINTEGDFEEYHQQEFYLTPPIKKNPHTGDLIQIENELYLILTPACDMIINYKKDECGKSIPFRKAENLILASVKDFNYKVICVDKNNIVQKGKIKEYVKNSLLRFHYIPPFKNDNGYLIDFQDLSTVAFNTNFTREATISAPFIKDIISRFAGYYSRQGQPTFRQDSLVDYLYSKK